GLKRRRARYWYCFRAAAAARRRVHTRRTKQHRSQHLSRDPGITKGATRGSILTGARPRLLQAAARPLAPPAGTTSVPQTPAQPWLEAASVRARPSDGGSHDSWHEASPWRRARGV